MAKNISLLGANYPDVPAVILPKTGGGTAMFIDADFIKSKTYNFTSSDITNNCLVTDLTTANHIILGFAVTNRYGWLMIPINGVSGVISANNWAFTSAGSTLSGDFTIVVYYMDR